MKTFVFLLGLQLHRFRADERGKYTAEKVWSYFRDTGVHLGFAATATPRQISMSERDCVILAASTRWFLSNSGLPKFRCGELMQTAVYLLNQVLHSTWGMVTPHRHLFGTAADLPRIRVIGAHAYVHEERSTTTLGVKA